MSFFKLVKNSMGYDLESPSYTVITKIDETTEIDVAKTTKQRGKGKVYSILNVYTDLDLAKQQIQEGLAEGQWSVKNTTPDANGYTVWYTARRINIDALVYYVSKR